MVVSSKAKHGARKHAAATPEAGTRNGAHAGTERERRVPVALSIAGFDPSSGAGVTADLKTFAAHGLYGVACITALTVQSTLGVLGVQAVAARTVRATLDGLADDMELAGVKLGMLTRAANVGEAARFLCRGLIRRDRVVLDPVTRSTSGRELLDSTGLARLRKELLGLVGWITPNLAELALLTDRTVTGHADVPGAARALRSMAAALGNPSLRVVVTGGHLRRPDDFLLGDEGESWLHGERIATDSTHGTGCAFSSALLCQLIAGFPAADAVTNAKAYVTVALRSAYPVGRGHGPMHHLFKLG
jgi:hydroxymethylpyrimidine/phosphomethylpyrimidine kinase